MILNIAGEKKEYEEGITVAELIEAEDVETPQYVSVSVNDDFVDSADFSTYKLQDGDQIEFIYFMGGGSR
ncbi:MAG: sulfur carrier protein ThiS [Eubacterium sp.]|nr:sulfur carrier protein ThiS [Eubacterium sp.]